VPGLKIIPLCTKIVGMGGDAGAAVIRFDEGTFLRFTGAVILPVIDIGTAGRLQPCNKNRKPLT
jgi:hypothetical protein